MQRKLLIICFALAAFTRPIFSSTDCLILDVSRQLIESTAVNFGIDPKSEAFRLLRTYIENEAKLLRARIPSNERDYEPIEDQLHLSDKLKLFLSREVVVSALMRSMNDWMRLHGLIQNEELIKRSETVVISVHQSNFNLQLESNEILEKKYATAAKIALVSGTFPFGDRQFVQEIQKNGTFVYSPSGHLLSPKASNNMQYSVIDFQASKVIFIGGACALCLRNSVHSVMEMFLKKGEQRQLHLLFEPDLIYTGERSVKRPNSFETLRERLDEVQPNQRIMLLMKMFGTLSTQIDSTFKPDNLSTLINSDANNKYTNKIDYTNRDGKKITIEYAK